MNRCDSQKLVRDDHKRTTGNRWDAQLLQSWMAKTLGTATTTLLLGLGCLIGVAQAQISADSTVNTIVTSQDSAFTITGGTPAGSNLFHSFTEFSVPTGGQAFFNNDNNITNIFSRVTGGTLSNIDGLLRTNGTANLFLLNPAGIIFGENSSLNLGGSFLATTAEQFVFANDLTFSASQPESAPLLAVNLPIGLQFGAQAQPIVQRSFFSQVAPQQSITLVGGNVSVIGASLYAPQGDINIAGVGPHSRVDLLPTRTPWTIGTDGVEQFQDVTLTQASYLDTSGDQGGQINIRAHNLNIETFSFLDSVHFENQSAQVAINLQAAATLRVLGGSEIYTRASGTGTGGSIYIQATDLDIQGDLEQGYFSGIITDLDPNVMANAGDIDLDVDTLHLGGGAEILSLASGQGNAGNINIEADAIALDTQNTPDLLTRIQSVVFGNGVGQPGDITIATQTLRLLNGAQILASNFGQGDGGRVQIDAQDIELRGINQQTGLLTGLFASVPANREGNAGNIILTTQNLGVFEGAQIFSGTAGNGNGGTVTLQAENVVLDGFHALNGRPSGILASVQAGAVGNGGSIDVQTDQLQILDGAQIFSGTFGEGDSGSITLQATDVVLDGVNTLNGNPSGILASAGFNSVGDSGDIVLNVENLSLFRGAQIFSGAFAQGDGGAITIQAQNLLLDGIHPFNNIRSSNILASVQASAVGDAGSINLNVDQLTLSNGAQIFNGTFGQGNGGAIVIQAQDILLSGVNPENSRQTTSLLATVQAGAVGDAGVIDLETDTLSLLSGAQIGNGTFGQGNGGPIRIQAQDIQLSGSENDILSGIFATVNPGAIGNAGTINLETDQLRLSAGAQISNSTLGQGNAGDITLTATQTLDVVGTTDGQLNSEVTATSNTDFAAGSVFINAGNVQLGPHGRVAVNAVNGQAGDIAIATDQTVFIEQGQITAITDQGDGGNLLFQLGETLQLNDNSLISTTAGQRGAGGNGGNITVDVPVIVSLPNANSDITANAFEGNGGNIQIQTEGLFGIAFRSVLTAGNDITASSQFGLDGVVVIETPDVVPEQGLVTLPTALIDVSDRIAKACETTAGQNTLAAIGRAGLPTNPRQPLQARAIWQDQRILADDQVQIPIQTADKEAQKGPLMEAQGWARVGQGRIRLVAQSSTAEALDIVAC